MFDLHSLKKILSKCSIADLQRVLDVDIVDTLIALDERQTPTQLAEALITCFGRRFFYIKKLRSLLIKTLSDKELEKLLRKKEFRQSVLDAESPKDLLDKINTFTWGDNEKSKLLLDILELNQEDFILPRRKKDPFKESIELEKKDSLESWEFSLHPYQEEIRKDIVQFLNKDSKKRLLVHMPTGSGKTRVMMEAVCDFFRLQKKPTTVIWMAYSDELCSQAAETFMDRWQLRGSYPLNILRFWGGRKLEEFDKQANNFVITSFDTAHAALTSRTDTKFEFFLNLRGSSSLVIVDEAHQAPAPTYSDAIELLLGGAKLVGLTATPGSNRQERNDVAEFFEKNKVTLSKKYSRPSPIEYLQDQEILSEIDHYKLAGSDINLTEDQLNYVSKQLELPDSVLKELGKDKQRNLVILQELTELVHEKKQTIVFATSVKHAQLLTICLKTLGVKAACIVGETPYDERVSFIKEFKSNNLNILINFGVLTTGFDAPNTDAVLIARPTYSVVLYSQMIGRGLRGEKMGGTKDCKILNVVDNIMNMPQATQAFTYFESDWNIN